MFHKDSGVQDQDAGRIESSQSLEDYRSTLDAIDLELLDSIHRRLDIVSAIAHFKREHSIPMMQPTRIGIVTERAVEYGLANGISVEYLKSLYELIIEESCRLEDLIIQEER
jgi:chorismate mutase